jgi:hypothetical protein
VSEDQLSGEDYDSIHAAVRTVTERGWRSGTLNEHVDQWRTLVASVAVGYTMTIDDYTNDLAVREWLDQVRPMLTERVRRSLDERLSPLDEQFRGATQETARHMPGAGSHWWYRLPIVLVGELREDAERMGLLNR